MEHPALDSLPATTRRRVLYRLAVLGVLAFLPTFELGTSAALATVALAAVLNASRWFSAASSQLHLAVVVALLLSPVFDASDVLEDGVDEAQVEEAVQWLSAWRVTRSTSPEQSQRAVYTNLHRLASRVEDSPVAQAYDVHFLVGQDQDYEIDRLTNRGNGQQPKRYRWYCARCHHHGHEGLLANQGVR